MSVRQSNVLGNQRWDACHQRLLDASVAGDFDLLAGRIVAGERPLVVRGFELAGFTLGNLPELLTVLVDGGISLNYGATAAGTLFSVAPGRAPETLSPANPRVQGSFSANTLNYVGLDVRRSPDDSTRDFVAFLDPLRDREELRQVPLGQTLDYVLCISTLPFSTTPLLAPLYVVRTDSSGLTQSVLDARSLMFRLGSGGDLPDPQYGWPWPQGRQEISGMPFLGGDKGIRSLKDWMDAVMTRLWEVAGGERWSSAVSDRNVRMFRSGTAFSGGEYFEWDGTHLHWRGISFVLPNSTGLVNAVADQLTDVLGLTNLADGECIYIDLDYSRDLTGGSALAALKAPARSLGAPVPGRSRTVIAWRSGAYVFSREGGYPIGQDLIERSREAVSSTPLFHRAYCSCTTSPSLTVEALGTYYVTSGGAWTAATMSADQTVSAATIAGGTLDNDSQYYVYINAAGVLSAYKAAGPEATRRWKATSTDYAFVTAFYTTAAGNAVIPYRQIGREFAYLGSTLDQAELTLGTATVRTPVAITKAPPEASDVTLYGVASSATDKIVSIYVTGGAFLYDHPVSAAVLPSVPNFFVEVAKGTALSFDYQWDGAVGGGNGLSILTSRFRI